MTAQKATFTSMTSVRRSAATSSSRARQTITPGWSAGYVLHIEAMGSDGLTTTRVRRFGSVGNNCPSVYSLLGGRTNGYGVDTLQSFWFVKSEQLGKVSVGLQSQASDNTAILVDGSGSLVPANWVAFDTNSMGIRRANGALVGIWGGAQSCGGMGGAWGDCNGLTHNSVRYNSPTFGGFSVSASWGEDDFWDIAARYAGEHHGFKIAAAVAYNETTDQDFNNFSGSSAARVSCLTWTTSRLACTFSTWLRACSPWSTTACLTSHGAGCKNADTWYVKAGLRTRMYHPRRTPCSTANT